jgi:hypothetical protein
MDESTFWSVMEWAAEGGGGDRETMLFLLTTALAELEPGEIEGFKSRMTELVSRADRWNLWGAAYIMNGGDCSQDGFLYFRAWLLAQGRETFEVAIRDPDALAARRLLYVENGEHGFELLMYAPLKAYEKRTGEPLEFDTNGTEDPQGEPWTEESVWDRWPALAAKYR